jgi:hypothetical protein
MREMVAYFVHVGRSCNRFLQQLEPARGVALLDQHPAQRIRDRGAVGLELVGRRWPAFNYNCVIKLDKIIG